MDTFVIVAESDDGYVIMAPDGETAYVTKQAYEKLKNNNNEQTTSNTSN